MRYFIIGLLLIINSTLNAQNKEEEIVSYDYLEMISFTVNDYKNTFFIMNEGSSSEEKGSYYNFDKEKLKQINTIFNKYMLHERFSSFAINGHYVSEEGCLKMSEVVLTINISYSWGEWQYNLLMTNKENAFNLLRDIDAIFGNEHKMSKLIDEIRNIK